MPNNRPAVACASATGIPASVPTATIHSEKKNTNTARSPHDTKYAAQVNPNGGFLRISPIPVRSNSANGQRSRCTVARPPFSPRRANKAVSKAADSKSESKQDSADSKSESKKDSTSTDTSKAKDKASAKSKGKGKGSKAVA